MENRRSMNVAMGSQRKKAQIAVLRLFSMTDLSVKNTFYTSFVAAVKRVEKIAQNREQRWEERGGGEHGEQKIYKANKMEYISKLMHKIQSESNLDSLVKHYTINWLSSAETEVSYRKNQLHSLRFILTSNRTL